MAHSPERDEVARRVIVNVPNILTKQWITYLGLVSLLHRRND